MAPPINKHDLYERCVQSTTHLAPLLRAIHGGSPTTLAEDFAGTAALSHLWIEHNTDARAVATDLDAEALHHHGGPDGHGERDRLTKRLADVKDADDPADIIFVGNFSIGYWHTRAELIRYLTKARERLASAPTPSPGVFVCDTYGGESAFLIGEVHRPHPLPEGWVCRYTWEQREADPLTGMVTNAIHFRIERAGVIEHELIDAFIYRWRLWSVPELKDAMLEAGFRETQVYAKLADAWDDEGNAYITPVEDPAEELDDSFIVLVAGRA